MGFFDLFKRKRSVTYVNGTLTVILNDNSRTTLVFQNASVDLYNTVNDKANTDAAIQEIYKFYINEQNLKNLQKNNTVATIIQKKEEKKKEEEKQEVVAKQEIVKAKKVQRQFQLLVESGDFTEREGSLYMNNIILSVPKLLAEKFSNLIVKVNNNNGDALDEYCALKNFWMWTSLCKSAESRESMFKYIANNSLKVNKYGFFVAYRNIVSKESTSKVSKVDKKLSEFITNSFLKIKGQKKSPKNFDVCKLEDGSYKVFSITNHQKNPIGNLQGLYNTQSTASPDTVQTYTDSNSRQMDIRIGKPVYLNPDRCDWNVNNECSRGLHISGSKDYGCGDTPIICLVNPMKVVACPYADGHKMRVYEYFPVAVCKNNEKGKIAEQIDTMELGSEYYQTCLTDLKEMIKNHTPQEIVKHSYKSDLSKAALDLIMRQAENIQTMINQRVVKS